MFLKEISFEIAASVLVSSLMDNASPSYYRCIRDPKMTGSNPVGRVITFLFEKFWKKFYNWNKNLFETDTNFIRNIDGPYKYIQNLLSTRNQTF